jgi:hypothetical protein
VIYSIGFGGVGGGGGGVTVVDAVVAQFNFTCVLP